LTWGLACLYLRHHAWEPIHRHLAGWILLKTRSSGPFTRPDCLPTPAPHVNDAVSKIPQFVSHPTDVPSACVKRPVPREPGGRIGARTLGFFAGWRTNSGMSGSKTLGCAPLSTLTRGSKTLGSYIFGVDLAHLMWRLTPSATTRAAGAVTAPGDTETPLGVTGRGASTGSRSGTGPQLVPLATPSPARARSPPRPRRAVPPPCSHQTVKGERPRPAPAALALRSRADALRRPRSRARPHGHSNPARSQRPPMATLTPQTTPPIRQRRA